MVDSRVIEFVDIVNDKVADHHYKESEDLSQFTSSVTGRSSQCPEGKIDKSLKTRVGIFLGSLGLLQKSQNTMAENPMK